MLCGGYALLSPRPPQQIWPDYYCNPGICNRWPSQFLVLLYLRTAQAFSWQHAPGSHPPSLFGAPVSCATVCDPSLLCDSFLVAPAPGAKPFFSRQTASVEQFLFVWRTISLCFLCFRFHNKHSRDRPPQQISKCSDGLFGVCMFITIGPIRGRLVPSSCKAREEAEAEVDRVTGWSGVPQLKCVQRALASPSTLRRRGFAVVPIGAETRAAIAPALRRWGAGNDFRFPPIIENPPPVAAWPHEYRTGVRLALPSEALCCPRFLPRPKSGARAIITAYADLP